MLYRHHLLSVSRELLVMGGDSAKDQLRALAEGVCSTSVMVCVTICATPSLPAQVDIVSGTPGRLDDMISTGKLDLSNVSISSTT